MNEKPKTPEERAERVVDWFMDHGEEEEGSLVPLSNRIADAIRAAVAEARAEERENIKGQSLELIANTYTAEWDELGLGLDGCECSPSPSPLCRRCRIVKMFKGSIDRARSEGQKVRDLLESGLREILSNHGPGLATDFVSLTRECYRCGVSVPCPTTRIAAEALLAIRSLMPDAPTTHGPTPCGHCGGNGWEP